MKALLVLALGFCTLSLSGQSDITLINGSWSLPCDQPIDQSSDPVCSEEDGTVTFLLNAITQEGQMQIDVNAGMILSYDLRFFQEGGENWMELSFQGRKSLGKVVILNQEQMVVIIEDQGLRKIYQRK